MSLNWFFTFFSSSLNTSLYKHIKEWFTKVFAYLFLYWSKCYRFTTTYLAIFCRIWSRCIKSNMTRIFQYFYIICIVFEYVYLLWEHSSMHLVLSYSVYGFCTNNITIITVRGQHREKPPRSGLQPSRAVQQPPLTSPRPPMTSSRPPRPSGGPASGSQTLPSSPAVFASRSPVRQVRNSFC